MACLGLNGTSARNQSHFLRSPSTETSHHPSSATLTYFFSRSDFYFFFFPSRKKPRKRARSTRRASSSWRGAPSRSRAAAATASTGRHHSPPAVTAPSGAGPEASSGGARTRRTAAPVGSDSRNDWRPGSSPVQGAAWTGKSCEDQGGEWKKRRHRFAASNSLRRQLVGFTARVTVATPFCR